ncbi:MAG: hypothetical protein AB2374_13385 [Cytobacillus gottheilii]|uniref:hypothetical protein n=1 Tax=Cytobacillus gottheilii TaxID=859144 RepID=UPI00082E0B5A|nr:hypothetical protein [Cytobacillus gottheilii]
MEILISFLGHVAIAIFLALNAPKYGKSPVLWGIFGFFFGILALGIYFVQTGKKVIGWILIIIFVMIMILIVIFFSVLIAFIFSSFS